MTAIIWSPQSLRDIESIRDFIAQDSPAYAELETRRIISAVERLQRFPQSGRAVPERGVSSIREVVASPYRIVYRLRGDIVEIATVCRASRLFPNDVR